MGLMDKFKNLFTEEVEVEEEINEEPIKKETIHVEIPSPVKPVEKEVIEPEVKPEPKEEFNFPFFDDDDFEETISKPKPKEKEERKTRIAQTRKETKEVYSPVREEKKVFKPTPIISPVYGILDKNYQKEDIKSKNTRPRSYYNPKEATVDEIRNKAYGTLEDEIETTLFGRNRLLFDDIDEEKNDDLIEKIKKEQPKEEIKEDYEENIIGERPRHVSEDEPELTELLEAELGKDDKEEKPHKISDSELFSMIDSMYQKGGKNDD